MKDIIGDIVGGICLCLIGYGLIVFLPLLAQ